jgi:ribosome maturation factor RimP
VPAAQRQRLRTVVEPVVVAAGYDLEDLSVSRIGRRYVVRVVVDRDGGLDLDAVADVSRVLSRALDEAEETGGDLIAGEYQLEVSSPGVDRPLTLPRHWRRNVGRLVKVTVTPATPAASTDAVDDATAAPRRLTGRVVAADEQRVVLRTDDGLTEWTYPELGPGRVQVEFSRLDEIVDDDLVDGDGDDVEDGDDEDVEGEER